MPQLSEFSLIRTLRRDFGRTGQSVIQGIGDDAAEISLPAAERLLLTTDLLLEGVHFDIATTTFESIGYKTAVANLSDIAAMGGIPRYALMSVAIPRGRTSTDITQLYRGLMRACRPHGVAVVGGDTSASDHGLFICMTLTGSVKPGRALRRRGARVGDLIYVTGTVGDSLAGLRILTSQGHKRAAGRGRARRLERGEQYLVNRHMRPTPRLRVGQLLAAQHMATAAIDVSDGLSGDLAHICEESGVGAEIEAAALPISSACQAFARTRHLKAYELALQGGEDYELLFTVSPANRSKINRLARRANCRITRIGTIRPKRFGLQLRRATGAVTRFRVSGYEHFRTKGVR